MNKKVMFAFLSLTVFISYFYYRGPVRVYEPSASNQNQVSDERRATIDSLKEKEGKVTEEEFLSVVPSGKREIYQRAVQGDKQQISFYVRIQDQDGKPVQGARVYFDAGGGFLSGGKQFSVASDKEGIVKVSVDGSFIAIDDVKGGDITYLAPPSRRGEIFYGFQPDSLGDARLWLDYASKDDAYNVKVWRLTDAPKLKTGNVGGSPRVSGEEEYTVFLNVPKRDYIKKGFHPDGQLLVRIYAEPVKDDADLRLTERSWRFEISAISGGIVEADSKDLYLNRAPSSGYGDMIQIKGTSTGIADIREFRYLYFKSNNNAVYGVLQLGVFATNSKNTGFSYRIQYKINTNRDQDLQSDGSWMQPY